MFKHHVLPLAIGLGLLGLTLWSLPDAMAQTVSVPIAATAEVPPQLSALPVIGQYIDAIKRWLPLAFQIVGGFAILASITANKTDDKVVDWVLRIINAVGFNFGAAKNDGSVGVTRPPGK